jgi:chromosome segregation ATPase
LQAGVRQFARIARQAPPDLKPLREIHDGLARFDEGLGAIHATLDPRRLAALRQAIGGAEGVVDEAARLADRAAGYTYPVVTLDGLKPRVASRPFWPRGSEVAADMRKVAGGVIAMEKEIGALAEELPKIQAAVAEGRKSIGVTRATLAGALGRQAEAERLLAEIPEQSARLAEDLPRLAADLTRALRGADRLKEVAIALRRSRAGLDATRSSLPAVQRGIAGSAALLRAARDQMDQTLGHRREYEAARDQVEGLAADLLGLLPALSEGLEARLQREDQTLAEMAGGLEQAGRVLPVYAVALGRCSTIGRLLAWLVATIAGVHGCVLLLSGFPWRRRALA